MADRQVGEEREAVLAELTAKTADTAASRFKAADYRGRQVEWHMSDLSALTDREIDAIVADAEFAEIKRRKVL